VKLTAKNEKTGETRIVHANFDPRDLEDADPDDDDPDAELLYEELSRCTGPCRCMFEVDCPCPEEGVGGASR
jgi:hypothetical protein